jgi:enoyl-CoA hydratase/carnithine racemase
MKGEKNMSDDHLLYRVEENVAYITINREKQRNAITPDAIGLFLDYLEQANKDEQVRVVLITGDGDKSFCTHGFPCPGILPGRWYGFHACL